MSWRIEIKERVVRFSNGCTLGETVGRIHGPPPDITLYPYPHVLRDIQAVDDQGRVWDVPGAIILDGTDPDGAVAETVGRFRLAESKR